MCIERPRLVSKADIDLRTIENNFSAVLEWVQWYNDVKLLSGISHLAPAETEGQLLLSERTAKLLVAGKYFVGYWCMLSSQYSLDE